MTYQDELVALGRHQRPQVQAVYRRYLARELTTADATVLMAAAIAQANARAYTPGGPGARRHHHGRHWHPGQPVVGVLPPADDRRTAREIR